MAERLGARSPRRAGDRLGAVARRGGLGLLALVAVAAVPNPAQGAVVCPDEWELEVAARINEERAAVGVGAVDLDVRLGAAARRHSDDMAANEFLSHTGSDGSTPWERMLEAGYPAPGGEIAGAGHWTPEMIVEGWMSSDPHRAILLDARYRHVGVGYADNPGASSPLYRHLWTADFGDASGPSHSPEAFCGLACGDGLDNDGDGFVDFGEDPGCTSDDDPSERPDCDDGLDNDGDGLVDFPDDPECGTPDDRWEQPRACGLGFELALLLPAWMALRVRRRARRRAVAA